MSRRRDTSKNLTDADRRVWKRVTRTVTPKAPQKTAPIEKAQAQREAEFGLMMRQPPIKISRPRTPGPLEVTAAKAVRRGRVRIDAKIDLHDLTLVEAYPLLERGLIRHYNSGKSTLLVITGKGARLEGKLRAALPGWLAGPGLRPIVATYAQAHIKHGGTGAWYVFLKKPD
jgi:DNA-nicking Smr family endonuclease